MELSVDIAAHALSLIGNEVSVISYRTTEKRVVTLLQLIRGLPVIGIYADESGNLQNWFSEPLEYMSLQKVGKDVNKQELLTDELLVCRTADGEVFLISLLDVSHIFMLETYIAYNSKT